MLTAARVWNATDVADTLASTLAAQPTAALKSLVRTSVEKYLDAYGSDYDTGGVRAGLLRMTRACVEVLEARRRGM